MRAAVYARYSTDLQSQASIEDQVRLCRTRIEAEGWSLVHTYTDPALSGAGRLRPAYQKLLEDARAGTFEIVVAEALDRLSRDQEDTAALYKQLGFAGVRMVTLAEGEISELHVGLKGTMNALFLKDLAMKTRRDLEGRVRQGRSGGGLCYGYKTRREPDAAGNPIPGGRVIDASEAEIVRSVFQEYAAGRSPRAIARRLNAEGVPGPGGRPWVIPPSAGMPCAAPASCTMNSTSAGWCGTGSATSRTRRPDGGWPASTRRAPGSFNRCLICASWTMNSGGPCRRD